MLGAEFTSKIKATHWFLREGQTVLGETVAWEDSGRVRHAAHSLEHARFLEKTSKAARYYKESEGIWRTSWSSYLLTGVPRELETFHVLGSHLQFRTEDLGHSSLVNIKPLGVNVGIIGVRKSPTPASAKQKLVRDTLGCYQNRGMGA